MDACMFSAMALNAGSSAICLAMSLIAGSSSISLILLMSKARRSRRASSCRGIAEPPPGVAAGHAEAGGKPPGLREGSEETGIAGSERRRGPPRPRGAKTRARVEGRISRFLLLGRGDGRAHYPSPREAPSPPRASRTPDREERRGPSSGRGERRTSHGSESEGRCGVSMRVANGRARRCRRRRRREALLTRVAARMTARDRPERSGGARGVPIGRPGRGFLGLRTLSCFYFRPRSLSRARGRLLLRSSPP